LNEAGQPARPGEVGELYVRSDSVAAGYWNKHEQTKETFAGDWLRTHDNFVLDEEGYYVYQGRADDLFKVGGLYVASAEVENALLAHEAVLECAVVAAADGDGLLKPKAHVVVREGIAATPALAAELQAFVKDRLAHYKYPRWVEFVPTLPKTATGKVQRYKLRQQ
ncbi:MAG: AMP-binding protein, partial [Chloroflexota bacterium]|nr:AMP-binding protein [Chloroflexota bacterium]